jgi:hypothetical protein
MNTPTSPRTGAPISRLAAKAAVHGLVPILHKHFTPRAAEKFTCWDPQARNGAIVNALRGTHLGKKGAIIASTPASGVNTHTYKHAEFDLASHFLRNAPRTALSPPAPLPPPFNSFTPDLILSAPARILFDEYTLACLHHATRGVALFIKAAYLENSTRHARVFDKHPPSAIITPRAHISGLAQPHCWVLWRMTSDGTPPPTGAWTEHMFM